MTKHWTIRVVLLGGCMGQVASAQVAPSLTAPSLAAPSPTALGPVAPLEQPPGPIVVGSPSGPPRGAKPGFWQQTFVSYGWLVPDGSDGFGSHDVELRGTGAIPLGSRDTPLLISPGFNAHLMQGPRGFDVPGQLYDSFVEFRILKRFGPSWGADVSVTPGVYSDLEQSHSEGLRITGRAVGAYTASPTTQWIAGIVYLDRQDVSLLPAFGVIYTPSDDTRLDLVFPRPRFARRYQTLFGWERWWYVGGEFGGNSYAVERRPAMSDILTYRDFRALLGWEQVSPTGLKERIELGYVFGRELEYDSDGARAEPGDTLLLRASVSF